VEDRCVWRGIVADVAYAELLGVRTAAIGIQTA